MISLDRVKEILAENHGFEHFKFVQVGNEVRFCHLYQGHDSLVGEGETPTAAGFARFRRDCVVVEGHSMTLKVGWTEEAAEQISKMFGLPLEDRFS